MSTTWTTKLVRDLQKAFEQNADSERAVHMAAYMKDQFPFLGIMASPRRALQRDVLKDTPRPSQRELERVVKACWRKREREYQYFGADYVRAHTRVCSADFLSTLELLITTKSWWDTVDLLAIHGVGAAAKELPSVRRAMNDWIESDNIWIARTAILHQLTYKQDTDAGTLFRYCERRTHDDEFFIQKGMGWALREYSKTDPKAVRAFLQQRRNTLPKLTQREAMKWLNRIAK